MDPTSVQTSSTTPLKLLGHTVAVVMSAYIAVWLDNLKATAPPATDWPLQSYPGLLLLI